MSDNNNNLDKTIFNLGTNAMLVGGVSYILGSVKNTGKNSIITESLLAAGSVMTLASLSSMAFKNDTLTIQKEQPNTIILDENKQLGSLKEKFLLIEKG